MPADAALSKSLVIRSIRRTYRIIGLSLAEQHQLALAVGRGIRVDFENLIVIVAEQLLVFTVSHGASKSSIVG